LDTKALVMEMIQGPSQAREVKEKMARSAAREARFRIAVEWTMAFVDECLIEDLRTQRHTSDHTLIKDVHLHWTMDGERLSSSE